MILQPFKDSDKAKATTVFIGEPISYSITKKGESAKISFKVVKTLRGKARTSWDVSIVSNINWSIPNSLDEFKRCFGTKAEVGVTIPDSKASDAIAVQNSGCNPPYIVSLTGKGMNCLN
jgi:hypothetical protein